MRYILILTLLITTGCASTNVKTAKLKTLVSGTKAVMINLPTDSALSDDEMNIILKEAIDKTYRSDTCMHNTVVMKAFPYYRKIVLVCYYIRKSKIYRLLKVYEDNAQNDAWIKSLDAKHDILSTNIKAAYDVYMSYADKSPAFKVSYEDVTGNLPPVVLDDLKKSVSVTRKFPTIKVQHKKFERFQIVFGTAPVSFTAPDIPDEITYKIINFSKILIPDIFVAENKHIKLIAKYDVRLRRIKELTVFNKTKEFIKLETIAGYYAGKINNNLLYAATNLAPMSKNEIKHKAFFAYKNQFTNKKSVQYGFSVGYRMSDMNKVNSLYSVKEFE